MQHICKNLTFAVLLMTLSSVHAIASNPLVADPTIFNDGSTYYLLGTDGTSSDYGFPVFTSTDLINWSRCDHRAITPGEAWGTKWFWAPQVIKHGDGYMLWYTAEEQVAYAYSQSPAGPFTGGNVIESEMRMIDPFLFIDDDGQAYLYHVRLDDGNKINVVKLDETLTRPDMSSLTLCIEAEPGGWEDTWNAEWRVSEGPTLVKHDGHYILFYSVNDYRNPDYAVGMATASSPMGPWVKRDAPIISRANVPADGPGHGDLFYDNDGLPHYVFHIHNAPGVVAPRRTVMIDLDPATLMPIAEGYRVLGE